MGTAPELAELLQTLAAPGQMVIDELTRRLLPASFGVQPLGRHAIGAVPQPVAAYVVSGEQAAESRFEARKGRDLPPMVGRDQELALLLERWALAKGGEGQAVLLVGEAGIGKSRLARALLDACAGEPCARFLWQCSPYHTGSALWPVIQALSRSAGLLAQDSTDTALDKLEALAGRGEEAARAVCHAARAQRQPALRAAGHGAADAARAHAGAAGRAAARDGRAAPLLLVVEDAQWIDPTTLELIERCLERIDSARMLHPHHQPAGPAAQAGRHPERHAAVAEPPGPRQRGGHRRAAGRRPAAGADAGHHRGAERRRAAVRRGADQGGAGDGRSGHSRVAARLADGAAGPHCRGQGGGADRRVHRPRVRPGAGAGSGRAVPRRWPQRWTSWLRRSWCSGAATRTNPRFTFKHALVQEAAYESLLRGKRQHLHARILEVLEARAFRHPA